MEGLDSDPSLKRKRILINTTDCRRPLYLIHVSPDSPKGAEAKRAKAPEAEDKEEEDHDLMDEFETDEENEIEGGGHAVQRAESAEHSASNGGIGSMHEEVSLAHHDQASCNHAQATSLSHWLGPSSRLKRRPRPRPTPSPAPSASQVTLLSLLFPGYSSQVPLPRFLFPGYSLSPSVKVQPRVPGTR